MRVKFLACLCWTLVACASPVVHMDAGSPADSGEADAGSTDAGSDAGSALVNACGDAADQLALTAHAGSLTADVLSCALDNVSNDLAVDECVQSTDDLSSACAACFGTYGGCGLHRCGQQCLSPSSEACQSCLVALCGASLEACSGVMLGQTDGGGDAGVIDAGAADAGVADAGTTDAGVADAGMTDAGMTDAGMTDAGMTDAGVADAGVADAGMTDAGMTDAGMTDAGMTDAGMTDAGMTDAGAADAGIADAGSSDAGTCRDPSIDCTYPGTTCVMAICDSHAACAMTNAPAETPCANLSAGALDGGLDGGVCDGLGHCVACLADKDCPSPATSCVHAACNSGVCESSFASAGTACSNFGGTMCNGMGTCVACNTSSDCAAPAVCSGGVCVSQCGTDLSNIGTGDFQISFAIQTRQNDASFAVVGQRSDCSASDFWDVRCMSGYLESETDSIPDGGNALDTSITSCTAINDGKLHEVVLQRVNGVLSFYIDGQLSGSVPMSTADWSSLPPFAIGTNPCDGVDGTVAFDSTQGSITGFCATTVLTPMTSAGPSVCQ